MTERVSGDPTGPGTFVVASGTDPEYFWCVEWQNPRTHDCRCPAFARHQTCRHVKVVFATIQSEWQARRAAEQMEKKS